MGPSLRWLDSQLELLAWVLAHGPAEDLWTGEADAARAVPPWTVAAMVGHARELAGLDLAGTAAGLVARGLLVEIDPAGEVAADFARAHRLHPLLLALGRDSSEPGTVLLGTAGQPVVALSGLGHAVWRAGQDAPTLWELCLAVAGAEAPAGEAATLLPDLLGGLHELLSVGAAYLDCPAAEGAGDAGVAIH